MTPIVSMRNLSVRVSHEKKYLIHNISYDIYPQDFLIILGTNGSGKTSLLKTINGTIRSYTGNIKIIGSLEVKKTTQKTLAQHIATITQNVNDSLFADFSLMQNFAIYMSAFAETYDDKRNCTRDGFIALLKQLNPKIPGLLHTKVCMLSGGEKQVFLLALNMFFQRDILMLDEHTSALDPKTASDVMKITAAQVEKKHITCVMTTHSLDDAIKYGNKLIAMKNGEIIKTFHENEKRQLSKIDLLDYCY